MSTPSVISQAATEHIAPAERIHYWEDYNRRALVALSCTSYSEQGLLARQTNIEWGPLRLAEIAGNAHAIERSPQTVRSAPKDSVFATLLLRGEAVFLHENGCLAATAGELIVYDTRRPYLFGFSSSMRQILVDVPHHLFTQACVGGGLPGPMLFGRGTAREGALVAALSSRLGRLTASRGVAHDPADAEGTVLDLLGQLAEERTGGRPVPDAHRSQLIVAESYIDRHLHDPRLGAAQVAGVLGISVRHLGRSSNRPAGLRRGTSWNGAWPGRIRNSPGPARGRPGSPMSHTGGGSPARPTSPASSAPGSASPRARPARRPRRRTSDHAGRVTSRRPTRWTRPALARESPAQAGIRGTCRRTAEKRKRDLARDRRRVRDLQVRLDRLPPRLQPIKRRRDELLGR